MTAKRYDGASWQDLSHFRRWNGSSWTDATFARRWSGSAWEEFWPAYTPISASIDPGTYNNTVINNTGPIVVAFDALVTGGDGTETYSWTLSSVVPSGTVSITAGASTDSVTVSFDNGSDLFRSATLNLTVDDGTSSDSASASINVTYGTPP